jgi:hypothetical protein
MVWLRFMFLGGWLLAGSAVSAAASAPEPLTLINGLTVTGGVSSLTASGVVVSVGTTPRTYPWPVLAPGTRFRYDIHYRMNLAGFLEGLPAASLTNAPDPQYDPLRSETASANDEVVPAARAVSMTNLVWRGRVAVKPSAVRGLEASVAGGARFTGLRLGTGADEVLVAGWETGAAARVTSKSLRGGEVVVRRMGQDPWTSEPQVVPVSIGEAEGTASVSWQRGASGAWPPEAVIAYRMEYEGRPVSWTVRGKVLAWVGADEAVPAAMVLDQPRLALSLVLQESGGAVIACTLFMGRWRLEPGDGMADRIAMALQDERGTTVAEDRVVFGERPEWPLTKAVVGAGYAVTGTVDLGAMFGRVEDRFAFTMPDPFRR